MKITGADGKEYALGLSEIMTHQGKDDVDPETGLPANSKTKNIVLC